MKGSNTNYILPITLVFVVLLSMNSILVSSHGDEDHGIAPSNTTWEVLDFNTNETLMWWTEGVTIDVEIGSKIIYNLTTQNINNFTHSNLGLFSMGNASYYLTHNNDLGLLLTLSIYPWTPGLITEASNWTQHINEAKSIAEESPFLNGTLIIDENVQYNLNGILRNAIKFNFNQTGGTQKTILIYDKLTGVLLYGYTEFFFASLFKLELQLDSSTLITESNITADFDLISIFAGVFFLVFINKKRRV